MKEKNQEFLLSEIAKNAVKKLSDCFQGGIPVLENKNDSAFLGEWSRIDSLF